MKRVILAVTAVLMCGCLFTGCPKNVPVNEPELTEEEKLEQIKEVCQKFVDFAPELEASNNQNKTYCWTKDGNIGIYFEVNNIDGKDYFRASILFYFEEEWQNASFCSSEINKDIEYTENSISYEDKNNIIKFTFKIENDCIHLITDAPDEYINMSKQTIPTFAKDLYFYPAKKII